MGGRSEAESKIRFGVFELDPSSGRAVQERRSACVWQGAAAASPQSAARAPGRSRQSRGNFSGSCGPDGTFVDFDDGLSTAVRKIRTALGDSATNPRFIETLPKRGYRFIASLEKGPSAEDQRAEPTALVACGVWSWCLSAGRACMVFRWRRVRRPGAKSAELRHLDRPRSARNRYLPRRQPRRPTRLVPLARYGFTTSTAIRLTPWEATQDARLPFWSSDGKWVGYRHGTKPELHKAPVDGGPSVRICTLPAGPVTRCGLGAPIPNACTSQQATT